MHINCIFYVYNESVCSDSITIKIQKAVIDLILGSRYFLLYEKVLDRIK
jgi:hypothetical protein